MQHFNAWTIYLWRNDDKIEGAAAVKTRDGLREIYRHGWQIEKDDEARRNEDIHQAWRAKNKVKQLLNNTLNVINWYGKQVLDHKGEIDTERLRNLEASKALELAKQNEGVRIYNQSHKQKKEYLSLDDIYPIKKFPVKEIDIHQAQLYGFK